MNDKEAIKLLREMQENCAKATRGITKNQYRDEKASEKYIAIDTILLAYEVMCNKIEKQQKEIEELKVINNMQKYRIEVIDERELIPKSKIEEILNKTNIESYNELVKCFLIFKKLLEEG